MEKTDSQMFKVRGNSIRLVILYTLLFVLFFYCYLQISAKWRYAFLFMGIIVLMQLFKPITYRISKNNRIESYYFWGRLKSKSIDIDSITGIESNKHGLHIIYRINESFYPFFLKLSENEVELMKNELLKRNPSIEVEN